MTHPHASIFPNLRRRAHRLLPLLLVALIGLQAQASCAMAGDMATARVDAAWVMHQHTAAQSDQHSAAAGHHGGSHGDGSTAAHPTCPGCESHDSGCEGDTCLQVVTDSPDSTVSKVNHDQVQFVALPATVVRIAQLEDPSSSVTTRTEFITERPPRLRFVRFLE